MPPISAYHIALLILLSGGEIRWVPPDPISNTPVVLVPLVEKHRYSPLVQSKEPLRNLQVEDVLKENLCELSKNSNCNLGTE